MLQSQVASTLEALGMDNDLEEEEDICTRNSGKQNMSKKSGLFTKMHDIVRKTVIWPHLKLGVRYSTVRNLDFEHLDLRLLVVGELEVIKSNDICDDERWSRLDILTDLMCAAGFYEWSAVKRLHGYFDRG